MGKFQITKRGWGEKESKNINFKVFCSFVKLKIFPLFFVVFCFVSFVECRVFLSENERILVYTHTDTPTYIAKTDDEKC